MNDLTPKHAVAHPDNWGRSRNMGEAVSAGGGTTTSDPELGGGDSNGQVVSGDGRGARDLTHISLFTGIGGFDLAAEWAGFRTIAMCEIEPFAQEVLKARFGAVADTEVDRLQGVRARREQVAPPRCLEEESEGGHCRPMLISDIRSFDGTRFRGATLLTGGFPCQPFSHAGKRRGREDDRALWPEMRRVIDESRPRWVIGENVSGLIGIEDGMAFEQVCLDLEGMGYEVQAFHIGAVGVNAPHRRMRVWIVAHNGGNPGELGLPGLDGRGAGEKPSDGHSDAQNPQGKRLQGRRDGGERLEAETGRLLSPRPNLDAPNAQGGKAQPTEPGGLHAESGGESWDIPWIEVATRFCRVDDGLPPWIHSRRVARLKALGNAIVPQVAHEIIKAIAEIERELT